MTRAQGKHREFGLNQSVATLSKHLDYEEVHIDIVRLTHIDVNFDVKYEVHENCSKTLSMHILSVFGAVIDNN